MVKVHGRVYGTHVPLTSGHQKATKPRQENSRRPRAPALARAAVEAHSTRVAWRVPVGLLAPLPWPHPAPRPSRAPVPNWRSHGSWRGFVASTSVVGGIWGGCVAWDLG